MMLSLLYHYVPPGGEPFGLKQALVVGGLLVGGLLIGWLSRTATEISTDNRRYRTYFSLLGLRLGRWQSIPPVVGVTLKYFATLEKASGSGTSNWGVWNDQRRRHEELLVMLSLRQRTTGLILAAFDPDDVNAAIDFAHELADRFGVPVNQYLPAHLFQPLPSSPAIEETRADA